MAFIQLSVASDTLGRDIDVNVITPERGNGPTKVLYLFHGLGGDHSSWTRRASTERYAKAYQDLTIVMPGVARSWYTDEYCGHKYYTFVTEELPQMIERMFNVSTKREDTFVAGLSMGGYGAVKVGLANPEKYSKIATMSGTVDIKKRTELWPNDEFARVFGPDGPTGINDTMALLDQCASSPYRPAIYQCCGTEDRLYVLNVGFREKALALGYDLTYSEEPETHNWGYWDRQIQVVLEWLFKQDDKEQEK